MTTTAAPAGPPAGRPRALIGAVALSLVVGGASAPAAGARIAPLVRPSQDLVVLLHAHTARARLLFPTARAVTVAASRPLTGERTVLPVVGRAVTSGGVRWLRVMLPGRPNGATGWIRQRRTTLTSTSWHVVVRTASRRALVYDHGRLVRSFAAIVGKASTPTPHGRFFVEESVHLLPGAAGGPYALALSARSDVLQEFDGGPGQIAIHGLANLGGTPGTAVSHGCVRLQDATVTWLAARVDPGVPVTITS